MDRIVQLEIRGVGGATAEETLGGAVTQVTGDRSAGFYKPDTPRSNKREVEAYEWGRLTSGAWSSAVWWILFPFTLMNVAGWMFQPTATERERSDEAVRSSLWWGRLLVVLGGLAITAVYVMWTVTLTTEIVAFGCADSVECSSRWYVGPVGWFDSNPVWLATVGTGLAALLILGLFLFIMRSQDKLEGYEADPTRREIGSRDQSRGGTSRLRRNTTLENQGFWYRWEEHRRLFRWHLGLTMFLLGASARHAVASTEWVSPPTNARIVIAIVILVVMIALWLLSGPEKFRNAGGESYEGSEDRKRQFRWALTYAGIGIAGYTIVTIADSAIGGLLSTPFGYLDAIRNLSYMFYVAGGFMVVLLWRRHSRSEGHTALDGAHWLLPVLAAALSITIAGAGFVAMAHVVGRGMRGAQWVADNGFDIVLVDVLAVSILAIGGVIFVQYWFGTKLTGAVRRDYYPTSSSLIDRETSWVRAVARARMLAKLPSRGAELIFALVLFLVVATLVQLAIGGFDATAGADSALIAPLFGLEVLSFLHPVAAIFIVLYVFPGVQLIRTNARSRASRRQLGKVWDVLSFWPRRFHPLAAPCYAERAVPEFRDRIRHHLLEGKTVIISSHSQGTVIAFAALAQIAAEAESVGFALESAGGTALSMDADMDVNSYSAITERRLPTDALGKVGLVTFGSPLSTLYGRFFPEIFGAPGLMQGVRDRLAILPSSNRKAWRNLWRPTDYIGQEVFVEPAGVLSPEDPEADIRVSESSQPLFPYESHSNYEREAQLKDTIDLIAGEIA